MSYLGRSAKLSLKAQEKVSFLATAGQTVKTGLSYVPSFVEVYVNGVLLTDTTDFTATNGNSITFTVALLLNDEVTVISLKTFTVADHYNKAETGQLLAARAPIASPVFTGTATTNLLASNGTILGLQANGTSVGSIGTSGGATYFGSADSGIMFNGVNQNPTNGTSTRVDNTNDLGASSYRYKDIYLGGGAFLGGTATANKLDDYEEGTFTATLTAVNPPSSPPTATGKYVKVGNMCHFVIYRFSAANTTGASGHMRITGLPFTCGKSTYTSAPFTHGFDFNHGRNQFLELNNGNTILYAYESVSGSAWTDWNITAGTGKYMVVSGSYITS